jgi:deazaflavin-dependent oxidoreductase (nitroreductase family)
MIPASGGAGRGQRRAVGTTSVTAAGSTPPPAERGESMRAAGAFHARRGPSRPTWPSLLRDRRALIARLLLRSPVWLYRLGLGWILGHEFLLLTHAGRRTGRVRETALKVLHHDPATRESIVASAWGRQTDWFRNIQARPPLSVRIGSEWYVPRQRILPSDEAAAVLQDWTRRQRWFARLMLTQLGLSLDMVETERAALVDRLPFVAFSPSRQPPPTALRRENAVTVPPGAAPAVPAGTATASTASDAASGAAAPA